MRKRQISRRGVLKGSLMASVIGGTASYFGPWKQNRVWAQGAAKPIKLGLTCDASGQYGDSGQDDLRGIKMAIDEFNAKGGVLGRKVQFDHRGHGNDACDRQPRRRALYHARRLHRPDRCRPFRRRQCDHPGRGEIRCDLSQHEFLGAERGRRKLRPHQIRVGRQRHQFLQGVGQERGQFDRQELDAADQRLCLGPHHLGRDQGAGGRSRRKIVDNLLVPQVTRDFTSYLLKIQQAKPDVVATAIGGDDIKALRQQVTNLKLEGNIAWINNQQDWPDVWGVPDSLFGVFGTTWYHKLKLPGVDDFVKRWQATTGPIPVPGNVSYNGYMATRELFRAMERAGSTNNIKVIQQLENLKVTAADRMQHHDAYRIRRRIICSRRSISRAATLTRRIRPTCTKSSPRAAGRDDDAVRGRVQAGTLR